MITILTTTNTAAHINSIIDAVDRLNELVTVSDSEKNIRKGDKRIRVVENKIIPDLDWFDSEPPFLFPTADFSKEALLAMVFYKLGNEQQALEYLDESHALFQPLLIATKIKFGYEISNAEQKKLSEHNIAVGNHYGSLANPLDVEALEQCYKTALNLGSDTETKCYTAKHYANLLLDAHQFEKAAKLCAQFLKEAPNEEAKTALKMLWTTAKTKGLKLPYNEMELLKLATTQVKCIDYLQEHELELNAGLLAMEASDVSNYLGDYPTAKEYITMAIKIFKEHGVTDLLGEAGLKKATLLYNWSKNGSPQYYKASINAFQDALKIFKRDTHPNQFAEIHHSLALIYSEIPTPPEEKGMWIAFSASSFKEALNFFTAEKYPYEHAMVCHNYATALMDFPPAKLHNNHEKANDLFNKALAIRTAEEYPTERALTLLNHIELGWLMHNENQQVESERLDFMKKQAEEVLVLVDDEYLHLQAQDQLRRLEELKELI